MVNKFIVSNNHYSLVTSKFSTIKKTLKQFYLINQLLLIMCLSNVNITRLTTSEDVAPIKLIPDWFFGGIKPIFLIVKKSVPRFSACVFLVNKTTVHSRCTFSQDGLYFEPTIELPYYGDINIKLHWKLKKEERNESIDLERRLKPNFTSINFPPIYCCIKGPNLTFTGSNFYSLFEPSIHGKKASGGKPCTALNNYTLTCERLLFESANKQMVNFAIFSHRVRVSELRFLIIEPLPYFIWAINNLQLSVKMKPKWIEFVDPVIIKVYKSYTDLLVECTVQVDLQSDWLTCDKLTPKEEPSTLSCVVIFGTKTIPANTTVTSHITIPTITEVTTVTTQSNDADSNGNPSATIIIILVVLIFNFLAWAVYLFHVNKLLARKLSSASLSTLSSISSISSISRIPYITVTSKDTHQLTKFTLSTLSSEQVSPRSGKRSKKKGGPPTK